MNNWKDLNDIEKKLELKRQRAILGLEAEFTFQHQQALIAEAKKVIMSLNGKDFNPEDLQNEIGINQQALLIEAKRAGYVESEGTKTLRPVQYSPHVYVLSPTAREARKTASLQADYDELLKENAELKKKLTAFRKEGKS